MAIGPREGVLLGANFGRAIVTNGDFTAYMCATAPRRGLLPKLLWADLLWLFNKTINRPTNCMDIIHSTTFAIKPPNLWAKRVDRLGKFAKSVVLQLRLCSLACIVC